MARPTKKGLDYFPKDVGYYEDFKIGDLMNEYGPLGQTIYDVVISMVYREGYFLDFGDYEQLKKKLPVKIIKTIGNRWINKKDFVLQVILSCADIGLFDKDLLMQGVITSVGIQRRYDTVTVRSKVQKVKYRLVDENGQPLLNAPLKSVNATETRVNATETNINVTEMQQRKENKTKVNKRKETYTDANYFQNVEVNVKFCEFLKSREENGELLTYPRIMNLIEILESLSKDPTEQLAIIREAIAKNWKSFYPLNKTLNKNRLPDKGKNNFTERQYSKEQMTELEKMALGQIGQKEK